jgi:hypothetical protein
MDKVYTLGALLEELKEQTPKFEVGQFLEVQKSIYPTSKIFKEFKNILIEGGEYTLPLATSQKAKRQFKKDKSPFFNFSKDNTRGDFLEIIETDGSTAKCINRSLKDEIQQRYYINEDMKYIQITFEDVIDNTIKRVYRGIKKYI